MSTTATRVGARILEDLADIEQPPESAPARQERAARLVGAAGGDRAILEDVRAHYLNRLHLRSDDFRATEALRTIASALQLVPTVGEETVRPRRRWWLP